MILLLYLRKSQSQWDSLYANAETYFKSLSTNSRIIYSESEKHFLHIYDSDLVVKSIKELVSK